MNNGMFQRNARHASPQHGSPRNKLPANWWPTLKKLAARLMRYRLRLFFILLLVFLSSVLSLIGPYLIGYVIDNYLGTDDVAGLLTLLIILCFTYIGLAVSSALHQYFMIDVSQRTVASLRKDAFNQLVNLPMKFFSGRKQGEMMSRLTNDLDSISQSLNSAFIQICSSVLTFTGMLGLMLWLSPLLTLVTLTIVPLMFFGMKWITARTGRLFKEQQRDLGELNGLIEETLSGQRIVTVFSKEQQVRSAFKEKNQRYYHSAYWAQTYSGFISKLMILLNNFSFAIIAGAGGLLALYQLVTIGIIVTFTEYARQFARPLNDLAAQFNLLLSAVAGAERVFELIEEPLEEDHPKAIKINHMNGSVEFKRVSFTYGRNKLVLDRLDLKIDPGETVALVGPTGAGKSTVVQLLSRFYDVTGGEILMDGHDIRLIQRKSLRSQMAFVLQDVFLFDGTIQDNIRYGKLNAADEEVEQAARLANAHGFITKLEAGYLTRLSHDNMRISQGQKQLLSIARAILADPAILVLDEATSNIDTVTEIRIQEALFRLMKGRTSIVIAHRLNTIRQADQIIVLDQGRIVEKGSHASLLRQQGYYYRMFEVNEEAVD